MFFTLRILIVIGVIFYFSPVRQTGEVPSGIAGMVQWSRDRTAASATSSSTEAVAGLEMLWRSLSDGARKSVMDSVLASNSGSPAARLLEPRQTSPTDTLQPDDIQPAWRGETRKPRL
jgi:hypothetical protein